MVAPVGGEDVLFLPPVDAVLPSVSVEATPLRLMRTLLYSATLQHEHLGNLPVQETSPPSSSSSSSPSPSLPLPLSPSSAQSPSHVTITGVHPTAPLSPPQRTIPLLADITTSLPSTSSSSPSTPRPRRATHDDTSLTTLFPLLATCQIDATPAPSPARLRLRLHLWLPDIVASLRAETSLVASGLTLTDTAVAILLRTAQPIGRLGLLLRAPRSSALRAVTLSDADAADTAAQDDPVGAWHVGAAPGGTSALEALLAFADAVATRRNRRLPRQRQRLRRDADVGAAHRAAWFRRHVVLLRFAPGPLGTAPVVSIGELAVRERHSRFVADLSQPGHASFRRAVPCDAPLLTPPPQRPRRTGGRAAVRRGDKHARAQTSAAEWLRPASPARSLSPAVGDAVASSSSSSLSQSSSQDAVRRLAGVAEVMGEAAAAADATVTATATHDLLEARLEIPRIAGPQGIPGASRRGSVEGDTIVIAPTASPWTPPTLSVAAAAAAAATAGAAETVAAAETPMQAMPRIVAGDYDEVVQTVEAAVVRQRPIIVGGSDCLSDDEGDGALHATVGTAFTMTHLDDGVDSLDELCRKYLRRGFSEEMDRQLRNRNS